MNIRDFYNLVECKQDPEASMLLALEVLTQKYPFFQAGIFTYIKCLYLNSSDNFNSELQRLTPFVQDKRALFYYVLSSEFAQFFKNGSTKLSKSRTEALIDAFFDTLGYQETESQLENTIDNIGMASLDYFSYLEASSKGESGQKTTVQENPIEKLLLDTPIEEDDIFDISPETLESTANDVDIAPMKHQSIIDNFISNAENSNSIRVKIDKTIDNDYDEDALYDEEPSSETELNDDFFFTQTLANIYIKQKKYQRAYEIIKRLSLNYPEKNIYFADQLSFLEKILKNLNHNK